MFWESSNICEQYVSILDTEDLDKISLEELIDELPNLTNDYDVGNEKLIAVLKRRDILESLIKHITETPPEHLDEHVRFKYANQSCVLFSSKSNQMETELLQQPDLLDRLIDFLKTDDELNPLMASFFANTLFSIYNKFNEEMIGHFKNRKDFFDLLFKHIATSAIMDFLLKITTLEPVTSNKKLLEVYQWLNNQNLFARCMEILKTSENQNALENTSYLLIFLIQRGRQSLISEEEERKFYRFYNEAFLTELVDICFVHKPSAIHVLKILIQFIDYERYIKIIDSIKKKFDPESNACNETEKIQTLYSIDLSINNVFYEYLLSIKNLHKVILLNLEKFKNLLLESVPSYSINTTYGIIKKPIGFLRLEIIHLFYALLLPNNPDMDEAFAKYKILEHLFDLFFKYEFNSFLHNHVNNIVATIFLNANTNRFKLLTNDQEKAEFLSFVSIDNFKKKTFMQLFNLIWSDNENYQFFKRSVESANEQISLNSLNSPIRLEYTPLIAQMLNECNLIEKIMNKYKTIQSDKEKNPKQAVPTYKSHLIDIANIINDYLQEYEKNSNGLPEKLLQENLLKLQNEWFDFSNNELTAVKTKIIEVEQNTENQRSVEHNFKKFLFQDMIDPVEINLPNIYTMKDEFNNKLFETQFDKKIHEIEKKEKSFDCDLPKISKMMDQSLGYINKFKDEIDIFEEIFDGDQSVEDVGKQKEIESISDLTEQFSETGEQMSNMTDRENIFQPLASSSNISNELKIVMDDMIDRRLSSDSLNSVVSLKQESDSELTQVWSFEKCSTIGATNHNDNQVNESRCKSSEKADIKSELIIEDDDWVNFDKERANK